MNENISSRQLAHYAVSRSLFAPQTLVRAIDTLGYVQADPIRAPARAQDLILRHRDKNYRVDDLEKKYPDLDVAEDVLHNYGFFPHRHLALLYPRKLSPRWQAFIAEHQPLRRKVLEYLGENIHAHPREIERALGMGRRTNGWGGSSSATTMMLESLHREGRAAVVYRESGVRVYGLARRPNTLEKLSPTQRADGLIQLLVNLYAPLPLRSLTQLINMIGHYKPAADYAKRIELMVSRQILRRELIDGLVYVWPADEHAVFAQAAAEGMRAEVKLLAPFDPIVWDRRRFEHLWGWAYRFEAYTPLAKRKLGYYALPMLWRENIIGWANIGVTGNDNNKLSIDIGFATKKPREVAFREALDEELGRFRLFLRY